MDAFDIAKTLLSMRAPEPDAAGDAGDGSGTVEGLSLFRRVTGGERQLSPRCIADADDLASVVTQGRRTPSPGRAEASPAGRRAPGVSGPEVGGAAAAWARREAAGPSPASRRPSPPPRSRGRSSGGRPARRAAPAGAPRRAFENWPAPRQAYGAVRALPPPVAGGVVAARVAVPLGGLASDSERRVLEILQWLACSERLHSWAALDLDGLRGAHRSVARAAKANPTFGGRFVAARRLDDAAETELLKRPAPPSPGRGRPAVATVAVVRDAAPGSPDADAPRKERPRPIVVPAPRPGAEPGAEGAENANSAPRSPTSGRAGRKLLRCLDENTPTERSPFSRPANKHFRAAAADAAAAPPDAPLLPQLSPFTKVAAI
ncbi:hypothetical protein JL720_7315 [Aureococcus anophagefferens]|nr:hypothetical protein JL720_7315 [Aureococcus anophagefferens]